MFRGRGVTGLHGGNFLEMEQHNPKLAGKVREGNRELRSLRKRTTSRWLTPSSASNAAFIADLEGNRIPLNVHVELEIVKGKYGNYDIFLAAKIEAIKAVIRSFGMNPEQIPTREALNHSATTCICPENYESHQLHILHQYLRDIIRQEALKA